jgi:hypothetical protein
MRASNMAMLISTTEKSWAQTLVRAFGSRDRRWPLARWRTWWWLPSRLRHQRLLVKDSAFLRRLPVGTARVEGVITTSQTTIVLLRHFNGVEMLIDFSALPASDAAEQLAGSGMSPVAVLMQLHASRIDCSVLCSTAYGPRRLPLSTRAALSLCAAGCHTVLRCEPTTVNAATF